MTVIRKLKWRSWIAFLLVFMMVTGLLPVNVFNTNSSVSAITAEDGKILIEINIPWFYNDNRKLYISTPSNTAWQELTSFSASNNYIYDLSGATKIKLARGESTPDGNYYSTSAENYTGEITVKAGDFLSFSNMDKGSHTCNTIESAKIVASADDGIQLFNKSEIVFNGEAPSDTNQKQTSGAGNGKYFVGNYEYTGRYITHNSDFYDYKTDTEIKGKVLGPASTISSGYTDPYTTLNKRLQYAQTKVHNVDSNYVEFDLSSESRYKDSFYLYMWDDSNNKKQLFGDFPGKKVTDFSLVDGTTSVIKVPVGGYSDLKAILSTGKSTDQTSDQSVEAGKRYKIHTNWNNFEDLGGVFAENGEAYSNPVYFGCFWRSNNNNEYNDGNKANYSNFKWVSNMALRNDNNGANDYRLRTSVSGLVAQQADESDGIGRMGYLVDSEKAGLTLPYLNRKWSADNSDVVSMTQDVQFPFYEVKLKEDRYGKEMRDNSGNYPLYYQFNSRDAVSLYLDPTSRSIYEHKGMVYSQEADQGGSTKGFFPYNIDTSEGKYDEKDRKGYYNNLAFGVKYEIPFVLTEDGKINGLDTTFEFMGDDDVWVFVDGQLVLDMGGGHKDAYGKINFNINNTTSYLEQTVSVSDYDLQTAASHINSETKPFTFSEDSYIHKDATTRKYRTTKVHTLTMYFMERGMWESDNFIRFNFTKQNILNVDSNVELDVNPGFVKKTYQAANLDVFNYSLDNTDITTIAGEEDTKNGLAFVGGLKSASRTVNYKDDDNKISIPETKTNINPDVLIPTIKVDEGNNNKNTPGPVKNTVFERYDRYITNVLDDDDVHYVTGKTDGSGEFGLLYAQYASFKNQFYSDSTLEIKQLNSLSKQKDLTTADALENGKTEKNSKRTVSKYYKTKWTLYDVNGNLLGEDNVFKTYNNGTYISDNERTGGTAPKNKLTFQNKDRHPTIGVSLYAEYVNTPNVGSLAVTKKLQDPDDKYDGEFSIKVKFTSVFGQTGVDMEAGDYQNIVYSVGGTQKNMEYSGGYGIIKLKANQKAVITKIPVGTKVEIAENDHEFHENVSITPDTSTEIEIVEDPAPSPAGEQYGVESTVTNKRQLGELVLSKSIDYADGIAAEAGDKDVVFKFDVTLTSADFNIADYMISGNPGGTPATSGIAPDGWTQTGSKTIKKTFDVSANNRPIQITGIPYGTRYSVTETGVDTETWQKITADPSGTIDKAVTNESITNKKLKESPKYGSIIVTKRTTGDYADTDKQFTVSVEFTNNNSDISGIIGKVKGASVTVDASNTANFVKMSFSVKNGSSVNISDIVYGTSYTITETSSDEYTTTVNESNTNTVSGTIDKNNKSFTAAFVNTAKPVLIKIVKKDGKGNLLPGAEFAIYASETDADAKTNPVVDAEKNTQGTEFTFSGLEPNRVYWIVETKIPAGHFGVTEPIQVRTGAFGTTNERIVDNPIMIEMPATGGTPFVINFAATGLFVMMLAVGAMLIYKKRLQKAAVKTDKKGRYIK